MELSKVGDALTVIRWNVKEGENSVSCSSPCQIDGSDLIAEHSQHRADSAVVY